LSAGKYASFGLLDFRGSMSCLTGTTNQNHFMTSAATVGGWRTKFARLGVALAETPAIAVEFLCV